MNRNQKSRSLPSHAFKVKTPAHKLRRKTVLVKPTLLSGGNPQIAKAEGDAPVHAYILAMPGWKSRAGRHIDELITNNVPNVRKAIKWNSPFYGIEGKGWFLNFHVFTKYIKIAFFSGTSLRPIPPGESKHENVRYLDIHEGEKIDEPQLVKWIRQAAAMPGWIMGK